MAEKSLIETYQEVVAELTAPGAPFAMTQAAVNGTTVRVYENAPRNLWMVYDQAEQQFADRDMVVDGERRWTYAEMMTAARRLSGVLQDRYGVGVEDRVGIASRNRAEWLVAFFAVTRIGATAVLFNSRSATDELAAAVSDIPCKVFIADPRRARMLSGAPVIVIPEPGEETPAGAQDIAELIAPGLREAAPVEVDDETPVMIFFTSGTTGRPKGAVLTHRNSCQMAANLGFVSASGGRLIAKLRGLDPAVLAGHAPRMSALLIMPLFHNSGITILISSLLGGGMMTTMGRWDPKAAMDLIVANGINVITGPTLVVDELLDQPGAAEKLSGLLSLGIGGQATPPSVMARISKALPSVSQGGGWGMTELAGAASSASGPLCTLKPEAAGLVCPVCDVAATDEDGRHLPPGQLGDLWVRSPMLMKGYWNAPEATAAVVKDGWISTGDIGYVDADGFVFIVDRKKDMVVSAGENIYCAEVERVLCQDPDFYEVAVFGVADKRLGERVVAAVGLRDGARRTAQEVQAFARQRIADYKVPTEIRFDMSPLPRNTLGKVDKPAVRRLYAEMARDQEPAGA